MHKITKYGRGARTISWIMSSTVTGGRVVVASTITIKANIFRRRDGTKIRRDGTKITGKLRKPICVSTISKMNTKNWMCGAWKV